MLALINVENILFKKKNQGWEDSLGSKVHALLVWGLEFDPQAPLPLTFKMPCVVLCAWNSSAG